MRVWGTESTGGSGFGWWDISSEAILEVIGSAVYNILDHSSKLLNLKQVFLMDWENSILLSGSIRFIIVFNAIRSYGKTWRNFLVSSVWYWVGRELVRHRWGVRQCWLAVILVGRKPHTSRRRASPCLCSSLSRQPVVLRDLVVCAVLDLTCVCVSGSEEECGIPWSCVVSVPETDKRKRHKRSRKESCPSSYVPRHSLKKNKKTRLCTSVCVWTVPVWCVHSATVRAFNLYICYLITMCLYCMYPFEAFLLHFPYYFQCWECWRQDGHLSGPRRRRAGGGLPLVGGCRGALSLTSSKDPSSSEPAILWNNLALM